jgi:hypothetical protein
MHMNKKHSMLALLLAVLLTWGAGQAWAVSRISGTFTANRVSEEGESGRTETLMTASDITFCYLSAVAVRDTDTRNEFASCKVEEGEGFWRLIARTGEADDQVVFCEAICFFN